MCVVSMCFFFLILTASATVVRHTVALALAGDIALSCSGAIACAVLETTRAPSKKADVRKNTDGSLASSLWARMRAWQGRNERRKQICRENRGERE